MSDIDVVERLTDNDSLLDVMIQIEDYLDSLDLYVFENWIDGIIVKGPWVKRYWIELTLKYDYEQMPNPQGALRLLKYGTKVIFEKAEEEISVEITTPSDIDPVTQKPKTEKVKIWLLHMAIPRRFIDELETDDLSLYDQEDVDPDAIEQAQGQGVDEETGITDDAENIDDEEGDEAIADDLEL